MYHIWDWSRLGGIFLVSVLLNRSRDTRFTRLSQPFAVFSITYLPNYYVAHCTTVFITYVDSNYVLSTCLTQPMNVTEYRTACVVCSPYHRIFVTHTFIYTYLYYYECMLLNSEYCSHSSDRIKKFSI